MKKNWYVVYTKSRCEKKVASLLEKSEVTNYCPLNRRVKQWADRKKVVFEPLFTSYVFIYAADQDLFSIKQLSSDIVNFVYWLGKPAVVKDVEIESIKRFLNEYENVKLEKGVVHIGDRVRIINGPLMNLEANIKTIENNTVKLMLPSLGYAIIAKVSLSNLELVNQQYSQTSSAQ